MNINFSLLFFFSILFLFFCSSSSSILHPISLSTRQEREVEKRRKKEKEEKREKKSREKLIVVSLHSLSYFILFCFFILFSSFPHNSPTLLGFFPSSSLTRVGLGDMQRILQSLQQLDRCFIEGSHKGGSSRLHPNSKWLTLSDSWRTKRGFR